MLYLVKKCIFGSKTYFTWNMLYLVEKCIFWMKNLFYLEYVVFDKKMYFSDEKLIVPGICCCLRWRESSHTWEVQSVTIGTKHSDNTIRTIIIRKYKYLSGKNGYVQV